MKYKQLVLFGLIVFLSLPLIGKAFNFQVDVTSRFIWRGFDLLPDNNSALQPSLTYDFGDSGFSLNVFASFALTKPDEIFEDYKNEIDLTLTYALKTSKNISIVLGFTNYGWWFAEDFNFEDHTTQEFFVELGFPKVLFGPKLTAIYDINMYDGLYVKLSGGHSVSIGGGLALDISATLGYNGGFNPVEGADTGFSDLTIGASVPFKLGGLTLSPFVNYTFVFLDAVNEDNELWFGASLIF
jgi:hypothetical protein